MSTSFEFEQPEHRLWVLFHLTYNRISSCEERTFPHSVLTYPQMAVMMAIKYAKPPVTPTDVAQWLNRSTNSITMIVDRMEREGMVERKRDLKDRRSLRLILTEKGEKAFRQVLRPGWEMVKYILSGLTAEEVQVLTRLLEKMEEKANQYVNQKLTAG
jgi:DNA-binding MarR family transcriptional regulator